MPRNPDQMLGFVIHETARLLRRRFEQYARSEALGLTRAQAVVLAHLARQEGINQAALAQSLDIEPITLVRLLDRLEASGFIERKRDPQDRRAHAVVLTTKARPMIDRIYVLADKVYADALADLSKREGAELLSLLHRMKTNLATRTDEDAEDREPVRRRRRA